ncbi:MarR family winged helix-turn-helix transcriptional regulator [Streptococcus dentasini]
MPGKDGGYLTLKIRLLNGRLFNRYLAMDQRALYKAEQGKILSALWERQPQTATDLAKVTGLAASSLSLMLKRLEEQGLIASLASASDKRKRYYETTSLGLSQQEVGQSVSQKLSDVFYRGFTEKEIVAVEGYLQRILSNLESEEERYSRH